MALGLISIEEQTTDYAVEEACSRIPPLWPLENFVAVNPFLGLVEMPFEQAARLIERVGHGTMLMDTEYYLDKLRNGSISPWNISNALKQQYGGVVQPTDPVRWLEEQLQESTRRERILSVADWLDHTHATNWAAFVVDEVSKWCSSYFDHGQCSWAMPWKDLPLYQAWRRAAELDANPEVSGLPDFRRYVRELPESEDDSIEYALGVLNVPLELTNDFLHRQLMTVFGWSAYAAYQDRQGLGYNTVRQLLAIRLAYDAALFSLDTTWQCKISGATTVSDFTESKYIAQLALEDAFRSGMITRLRKAPSPGPSSSRKALQAVFCIDVRSEVYRRALETQSPGIETLGFAGFFGMPLEVSSSARCPVLIAPSYQVAAKHGDSSLTRFDRHTGVVWKRLCDSASACFSAVEVGGAWFGFRLLQQFKKGPRKLPQAESLTWAIPLLERVELASAALKGISLDTNRLAQVVLLCGHGSSTENNPYGSSLDCGACGGHKGDINARFAAALMNDPDVREGLKERGILIPEDSVFVGGLHNTTTDEVLLYDSEMILTEQQRVEIEGWLKSASQSARKERNRALLVTDSADAHSQLEQEMQQRSADWSEVRPEWGLAGNAAFIAAPRSRTKHLNLEGRVFLHEYDSLADQDASVLALILTAPVIVASWINLQYFGSTVNNQLFGSGNKVLHNVVGAFGVWEGNGGDLRTGLPLQSLHDGEKWMHEPLRLQVFIEAPRERIDKVLRHSSEIRILVENNWIYLMAMEDNSIYECNGVGNWHLTPEEFQ